MNICYICSRYADPDPALRRRNIAEARALARWAEAQGYACVTWWGSLEPDDPPCDSDPEVRRAALARSAILAGVVGGWCGTIVMAGWYQQTAGMASDVEAYDYALERPRRAADVRLVSWPEVAPYYRAPADVIPRASVQAVADEMAAGMERAETNACNGACTYFSDGAIAAYRDAMQELEEHCGVTPSEAK